jgi:hypothetical protein
VLSPAVASKVSKITLNNVVSLMNNQASIATSQRAGRKRRQGKRGNQAILESPSAEAEDTIEVDESGGSPTCQRIESPDLTIMASSPSLRAITGRYIWRRWGQGQ